MIKTVRFRTFLMCIFIYILIFKVSFSNVGENTEEVYLQIRAEKLLNDFFMVRYDYETEKMYVGLNTLFYFLELYNLKVNPEDLSIDGKIGSVKTKVKFDKNEAFAKDGELFVDTEAIKKKLNFDYINYDLAMLSLDVKPSFMLPYQEKEQGRVERLRLNEKKRMMGKETYNYKMSGKIIEPGLLKLNYSKQNILKQLDSLNYEYGTQLLWGELYLSGGIRPESNINSGKLTYDNIYMGNNLTFGNINTAFPSFVSLDSSIIGVSFDNYTTYSQTNNGETVIKGEAEGADSIELYRNGMLVEYLIPTTRDFEFRIPDNITNAKYLLKIYYKDGRIEERAVYSLNDMDALKKGTQRPIIQLGRTQKEKKSQLVLKDYYGLTDNITVGLGYLDLNTDKKYSLLESKLIYNSRVQSFPTLINFTNYYELKQKQSSYELSLEQQIYDYSFSFRKNKYSKYFYGESGVKDFSSISFEKSFKDNSFEFGINKRTAISQEDNQLLEEKTTNIYAGWYTSIFDPFSFSLNVEKSINGSEKYIKYSPSLSISYGVTMILDADFTKYEKEKERDKVEYSLQINKRDVEIIKDSLYMDVGFVAEYKKVKNEEKQMKYGLTFSFDLESFFDVKVNSDIISNNSSNNESSKKMINTGVNITKVIDLASPLKVYRNTIPVNSYLIKGKVFMDRNGNGVYDNGDTPLEGVEVTLEGRRFKSDKQGNYTADGIGSGNIVVLDVDRKSIDPMMKPTKGPVKIKTNNSSVINIDIPIEVVSMITGNIWNASNFTEREFIQNISMTTIRLEKDGKLYKEIDPEFDGLFFFEDIPPGDYTIKFLYLGQDSIEFSQSEIPLKIKLSNPDEGEYFEGNDTMMRKVQFKDESNNSLNAEEEKKDTEAQKELDDNDVDENIDDIINNY